MAMSRARHSRKYDRNRNVLVIGGSGSGKTRGYIEPNIMQINAAGLATGADYALGTVLMLAGFAVMQRATLSTTNLTYREFLGNVRGMVLGRLRKGQDGPETRA